MSKFVRKIYIFNLERILNIWIKELTCTCFVLLREH